MNALSGAVAEIIQRIPKSCRIESARKSELVCQDAVLFPAHAVAYCDLRDLLEKLSNVQVIWPRSLATFRKEQQKRVEGITNSLGALKERSIYSEGIFSATGDDSILNLLEGRLGYWLNRLTATIVHIAVVAPLLLRL